MNRTFESMMLCPTRNDERIPMQFQPALLLGLCLLLSGCPSQPGAGGPGKSAQTQTEGSEDSGQADRCAALLNSLFDVYRIERLESTFDLSIGAARLNDWQRSCGVPLEADVPRLPDGARKILSDAQVALLAGSQFRQRDASHVRDCILYQALANRITQPAGAGPAGLSDVEKSVLAFYHVVRSLQVPASLENQNKHLGDLPFTAYELYLLGRGTAADRAWLFVNLLRTLRIDSVLLTPGGAEDPGVSDEAVPFLVAVLVEGQVYLFDPALGVPVPAVDSEPGTLRPATLEEVTSHPELLSRLDASDRKYPWTSEMLKSPGVLVVGDLGYFSLRIQSLQLAFSGTRSVIVADPLEDHPEVPGLWSRVIAGGGKFWKEDQIRLWRYPQEQISRSLSSSTEQNEIRRGLKLPFMAYLVIAPDPANPGQFKLAGVQEFRDPALQGLDAKDKDLAGFSRTESKTTSGRQMEARLKQLAGDLPAALKAYVEVQSNARTILSIPRESLVVRLGDSPAIDVKRFHARAIDDAAFWSGLCQFEQGEFSAAASTFDRYLRQASRTSDWARQARYLLATSRAAQRKYDEAIAALDMVSSEDPEYPGYQVLIQSWKGAR